MSDLGLMSEKIAVLQEALLLASENKAFISRLRNKLKAKKLNKPYEPNNYEYSYASWDEMYSQSRPDPITEERDRWGTYHC